MKRFLGIDYGTKRIGVAISDENGEIAFPKEVIPNDKNSFNKLENIIEKEGVSEIVVGESTDFSGKQNILSREINVLFTKLKRVFKLPTHKQKEFLTSVEARRSKNGKRSLVGTGAHSKIKQVKVGRVDASAAALILQRYLDRINKQKND